MKRSFIDVFNIFGFIIVLAVAAFAFYTLFIDKPFFEPSSYFGNNAEGEILGEGEDSGSYKSEKPVNSVEVGNVSGLIEVEGWNNDWIQLDYVKRGPGKPPEVKIDESGSKLTVKAVYPKGIGNFGSVNFLLKVPEKLEYLKAGSVSGRIKVSGLGEETEQKLSSTSGSVSTDSSGDLDISSVSGSLSFSTAGTDISASTTSGRIEGRLEEAPSDGEIDMSSVSGRVILEVPSDLNADIDLHSVSGAVSSEIPVAVMQTKKNSIKGVIGSGGTSIEMSSVSGAVKIID